MKRNDKTQIGGPNEAFQTTAWEQLRDLDRHDDARFRSEMGHLVSRYWKPVYAYLHQRGHDNESAKDLTQGFFQEVFIRRNLPAKADPRKGRFRTFLLAALAHYVADAHRLSQRAKRQPDAPLVPLDAMTDADAVAPADRATPDAAFDHAWAAALLDGVIQQVQRECLADGLRPHWQLFRERVLAPIMDDATLAPMGESCRRCGVPDESAASNMLVTVKRRFRGALRGQVRLLVASDEQVDEELADLMSALQSCP